MGLVPAGKDGTCGGDMGSPGPVAHHSPVRVPEVREAVTPIAGRSPSTDSRHPPSQSSPRGVRTGNVAPSFHFLCTGLPGKQVYPHAHDETGSCAWRPNAGLFGLQGQAARFPMDSATSSRGTSLSRVSSSPRWGSLFLLCPVCWEALRRPSSASGT